MSTVDLRIHSVYLLASLDPLNSGLYYVGYTTDPFRRLKQHNGELDNGAIRTSVKGRPWCLVGVVSGFGDDRCALRFEFCWHFPSQTRATKDVYQILTKRAGFKVTHLPFAIGILHHLFQIEPFASIKLTFYVLRPDLFFPLSVAVSSFVPFPRGIGLALYQNPGLAGAAAAKLVVAPVGRQQNNNNYDGNNNNNTNKQKTKFVDLKKAVRDYYVKLYGEPLMSTSNNDSMNNSNNNNNNNNNEHLMLSQNNHCQSLVLTSSQNNNNHLEFLVVEYDQRAEIKLAQFLQSSAADTSTANNFLTMSQSQNHQQKGKNNTPSKNTNDNKVNESFSFFSQQSFHQDCSDQAETEKDKLEEQKRNQIRKFIQQQQQQSNNQNINSNPHNNNDSLDDFFDKLAELDRQEAEAEKNQKKRNQAVLASASMENPKRKKGDQNGDDLGECLSCAGSDDTDIAEETRQLEDIGAIACTLCGRSCPSLLSLFRCPGNFTQSEETKMKRRREFQKKKKVIVNYLIKNMISSGQEQFQQLQVDEDVDDDAADFEGANHENLKKIRDTIINLQEKRKNSKKNGNNDNTSDIVFNDEGEHQEDENEQDEKLHQMINALLDAEAGNHFQHFPQCSMQCHVGCMAVWFHHCHSSTSTSSKEKENNRKKQQSKDTRMNDNTCSQDSHHTITSSSVTSQKENINSEFFLSSHADIDDGYGDDEDDDDDQNRENLDDASHNRKIQKMVMMIPFHQRDLSFKFNQEVKNKFELQMPPKNVAPCPMCGALLYWPLLVSSLKDRLRMYKIRAEKKAKLIMMVRKNTLRREQKETAMTTTATTMMMAAKKMTKNNKNNNNFREPVRRQRSADGDRQRIELEDNNKSKIRSDILVEEAALAVKNSERGGGNDKKQQKPVRKEQRNEQTRVDEVKATAEEFTKKLDDVSRTLAELDDLLA